MRLPWPAGDRRRHAQHIVPADANLEDPECAEPAAAPAPAPAAAAASADADGGRAGRAARRCGALCRGIEPRIVLVLAMLATVVGLAAWRFELDERDSNEVFVAHLDGWATHVAELLEHRVRVAVGSTYSLGAVVRAFPNLTHAHFDTVATDLLPGSTGVFQLQLAPGGIVAMLHPMRDEDAPAVGLSLLVSPAMRAGALAAIDNYPDRRATLAGPLRLLQGGVAVIARHPIFSADAPMYATLAPWVHPLTGENHTVDCAGADARERNCHFPGPDADDGSPTYFWGFATALTDPAKLTHGLSIEDFSGSDARSSRLTKYEYQLRAAEPHPSLAEERGIFAHSAGAPPDVVLDAPRETNISIPELGLEWVLAVAPSDGWHAVSAGFIVRVGLLGALVVACSLAMALIGTWSMQQGYRRRMAADEAARKLADETAAAAAHARGRLIRMVMHDLRSPLLAVLNLSKTLSATPAHTPVGSLASVVEAVGTCCSLMEGICSDMLDYERMDSGKLQLVFAPFSPPQLLAAVRDTFSGRAEAKSVTLDLGALPATLEGRWFEGDMQRIFQCLNNGVSNAIKFTDAGGTVRVSVGEEAAPLQRRESAQEGGAGRTRRRSRQAREARMLRLVGGGGAESRMSHLSALSAISASTAGGGSGAANGRVSHASAMSATSVGTAGGGGGAVGSRVSRASVMSATSVGTTTGGGGSSLPTARPPSALACLLVRVEDSGVGLEPDELAALEKEEMFTQVGNGTLQGNGGSGLGLMITRQLLALHNESELRIRSEGRGRGSTFELRLRCAECAAPPPASLAEVTACSPLRVGSRGTAVVVPLSTGDTADGAASGGEFGLGGGAVSDGGARVSWAGFRCLHVEDDPFMRMSLPPQLFDTISMEYEQAADGREACAKVGAALENGAPYGAIVIDNQMPGMSGTAAVAEIRRMGFSGTIIGMTGEAVGSAEREEFLAAGLDQCCDKVSAGVQEVQQALLRAARAWVAARHAGDVDAAEEESPGPIGAAPRLSNTTAYTRTSGATALSEAASRFATPGGSGRRNKLPGLLGEPGDGRGHPHSGDFAARLPGASTSKTKRLPRGTQ